MYPQQKHFTSDCVACVCFIGTIIAFGNYIIQDFCLYKRHHIQWRDTKSPPNEMGLSTSQQFLGKIQITRTNRGEIRIQYMRMRVYALDFSVWMALT